MYIRRSEDVLDIFWTFYVRLIYVLCLRGYILYLKFMVRKVWASFKMNHLCMRRSFRVYFMIFLKKNGVLRYCFIEITQDLLSGESRELCKLLSPLFCTNLIVIYFSFWEKEINCCFVLRFFFLTVKPKHSIIWTFFLTSQLKTVKMW